MPPTTNEAMKRPDDNFSSWCDFKEWMDVGLCAALKMGNDAVRSVDPEAYVGIGGGQMPGWGGYDYCADLAIADSDRAVRYRQQHRDHPLAQSANGGDDNCRSRTVRGKSAVSGTKHCTAIAA